MDQNLRNFKNKDFKSDRRTDTKMSSTAATSSVVIGVITLILEVSVDLFWMVV
tara:strand:+ start:358 stop:516 length:159 start_codon:yes stop_codon:yes gene_type:complete